MSGRPGSYALGLLGFAGAGQVGFLVALRVRELGGGFDDIGLIAAVSAVVPALLAVGAGGLIDRLGALRVFTAAATLSVVTIIVMSTFTDHRLFLLSGPILGTAAMASWTASQLHIAELADGLERVVHTGRFSAVTSLGEMAGPLMAGAAAQSLGPQRGLLVPAIYAALFIPLGLRLIVGSTRPPGPSAPAGDGHIPRAGALSLLRRGPLRLALVLSMSRLWSAVAFLTFAPAFLVESGLSALTVGTVLSASGLVAAIAAPMTGRLVAAVGELRLTRAALLLGAAAVALVPFVTQVPVVYLAPVLLGVANGLTLPLLLGLTAAAVPSDRGGTALGLRATLNQVSATAAPLAVGPVIAAYGVVMGFAAAGVGAVMLVVAAGVVGTRRSRRPGSSGSPAEDDQNGDRGEHHQHPYEVEEGDHDRCDVARVSEEREHLDGAGCGREHVAPGLEPDRTEDQCDEDAGQD